MKHRVVRVFPALLCQTIGRTPIVLDKAILVEIAKAIDPIQRAYHVGPNGLEKFAIARSIEVSGGQQNKQWRGIDAAIIAPERHFAQRWHLAAAGFMQNLAWFGVLLGGNIHGLSSGQIRKNSAGNSRRNP